MCADSITGLIIQYAETPNNRALGITQRNCKVEAWRLRSLDVGALRKVAPRVDVADNMPVFGRAFCIVMIFIFHNLSQAPCFPPSVQREVVDAIGSCETTRA